MNDSDNTASGIAARQPARGEDLGRLEVVDLCKAYVRGAPVVSDVSFSMRGGEFLTLLGPSGSGKTTTLMMIAGFESPSSGTIRVAGADIVSLSPQYRNFGVVFQSYALFPHLSALENVQFPLAMRRIAAGERKKRAVEMLEKVGLTRLASRRPHELSGGQQQRVALARALIFEPKVLLLDEPLGALDRKLREELQIEIKEIQKRTKVSVLLVTHDQDEAMMMSDRIAVMNHGRIEQIGDPMDLYQRPGSLFVATFLGQTNVFDATLLSIENGLASARLSDGSVAQARAPRPGTPMAMGDKMQISVRPERLLLCKHSDVSADSLPATVVDRTFMGRFARYTVDALGKKFIVTTSELDSFSMLAPGNAVRLSWRGDEAQILAPTTEPIT